MSKYKHAIAVIVLIILSTLGLYAFFKFFLFRLPLAASEEAAAIDTMIDIHFMLQAFLFAMIMVIMFYAIYAFRRQPGDEEDAEHIHGNTGLKILWTIVPTLVVIAFGIYGAVVLSDLLAAEPNEREVEVIGRQWSWQFGYPDIEGKTSGELGLLVNEPIVLKMQSEDVLHNFWVPEFRVKQDLLPGRWVNLRFTPTEEGTYKVRCAEICGNAHANMRADVLVMNQADYEAWQQQIASKPGLAELAEMSPAERGEVWYTEFGCNGCHSLDGSPGVGPTWQGLFGREEEMTDGTVIVADDEYLFESIWDPNKLIVAGFQANNMPDNFEQRFADYGFQTAEVITNDLIAFIKTLNGEAETTE